MPQDLWYVRKNNAILGPYPAYTISRYLLLGRLIPACEASRDRITWHAISSVPELMPLDAPEPQGWDRERWLASMRWADERGGVDRRQRQGISSMSNQRSGSDRRTTPESPEIIELRRLHEEYEASLLRSRQRFNRGALFVVLGAVIALAALLVLEPWTPVPVDLNAASRDCAALPGPGVNWSGCERGRAMLDGAMLRSALLHDIDLRHATLTGADLSYADLRHARLAHADLRGAKLLGANLSQASLAEANLEGAALDYANLRGVNLTGAKLDQASLNHAIWLDGKVCAEDSRGTCR